MDDKYVMWLLGPLLAIFGIAFGLFAVLLAFWPVWLTVGVLVIAAKMMGWL